MPKSDHDSIETSNRLSHVCRRCSSSSHEVRELPSHSPLQGLLISANARAGIMLLTSSKGIFLVNFPQRPLIIYFPFFLAPFRDLCQLCLHKKTRRALLEPPALSVRMIGIVGTRRSRCVPSGWELFGMICEQVVQVGTRRSSTGCSVYVPITRVCFQRRPLRAKARGA